MSAAAPSPAAPDPSAPHPSVPSPSVQRKRVYFVDIVRLIASFQMINGHTLDALMVPALKQGPIFEVYDWLRGLVSVAFLSVAGMAFHLATLARFDKHRSDPEAIKKRFRRAGLLLLLGYFLNFPGEAFGDDPAAAAQAWDRFMEVGVLQCIGVGLFLLELMTVLARSARQVVWGAGILAALAFTLAPLADRCTPEGGLACALSYLSHGGGSPFPLLPWAGFMLAGTAIGSYILPDGGRTEHGLAIRRSALVTAGLFGASYLLDVQPLSLMSDGNHPAASPSFALLKLGAVMLLVLTLAVLSRPIVRFPKVLSILSAETLTIYVFHLLVLYFGGVGLHHFLGGSLSLPLALSASAGMVVLTSGYAVLWHKVKGGELRPFALLRSKPTT